MKIGTVVEGPTDRLILETSITRLVPGEHQFLALQPVGLGESFGETGTGWKGVRRFCREIQQHHQSNIARYLADYDLDLLVIQLDADVINETDLLEGTASLESVIPLSQYRHLLPQFVAQWLRVCAICTQADRWQQDLLQAAE